jgi:carbonic anhydrase/acetyltransferase-like protein (isoleucine patch superfamily)
MDLADPAVDPTAFVAPTASLYGQVTVGERAVVMFGVVARAEMDRVVIGPETNVQDNTVLHTDAGFPCVIGRRVTVGHAAVVHGASVGDHALVGIRAVVLNGSTVGEGAWVAAGSLLPPGKSIPPWTLAVGIPAKPVRELTEEEIRSAAEGVDHYLEFGAAYRARLGFAG